MNSIGGKFEDTKRVIRSPKSKGRQHHDQKKIEQKRKTLSTKHNTENKRLRNRNQKLGMIFRFWKKCLKIPKG